MYLCKYVFVYILKCIFVFLLYGKCSNAYVFSWIEIYGEQNIYWKMKSYLKKAKNILAPKIYT